MTPEQLRQVLTAHAEWLRGEAGGVRANLTHANLSGANLAYAVLAYAVLSDADLSDANLAGARGVRHVSITAHWHGEAGRQILAVDHGEEGVIIHCGCFRGGWQALDAWISGHATDPRVTASRRAVAGMLRVLWDAREEYA